MDFSVCGRCGKEIESKGIHFRNFVFCSDECCEEFDAEHSEKVEPNLEALDDEDFEAEEDEDLGYREDDMDEDLLDDEFDIRPEDF